MKFEPKRNDYDLGAEAPRPRTITPPLRRTSGMHVGWGPKLG